MLWPGIGRSAAAALLALGGAACQPVPHPFAGQLPPAALLQIRDSVGVAVAPLVGEPSAVADKLGAAMVGALLQRDIPASEKTMNPDSYRLFGRVVATPSPDGGLSVTALWRLYDAKGRPLGERAARVVAAAPDEWRSPKTKLIARLAALSADELAPLVEDKPPRVAAVAPASGRVRVAIGKVSGAPGDGATSLANAVAAVLRRDDLAVVKDDAKADLTVGAEVTLSPAKAGKQHVKIVWHVRRRPDGTEIGTVAQENDVPRGTLDGAWGDVAYSVAIAAGDGLVRLVVRGAPAPPAVGASVRPGARPRSSPGA